jgi:hypothetical protein
VIPILMRVIVITDVVVVGDMFERDERRHGFLFGCCH